MLYTRCFHCHSLNSRHVEWRIYRNERLVLHTDALISVIESKLALIRNGNSFPSIKCIIAVVFSPQNTLSIFYHRNQNIFSGLQKLKPNSCKIRLVAQMNMFFDDTELYCTAIHCVVILLLVYSMHVYHLVPLLFTISFHALSHVLLDVFWLSCNV